MGLLISVVAGPASGQEPPPPPTAEVEPVPEEVGPEEGTDDEALGPAPGARTLSLGAVVALALEAASAA
jgi:hypothetical protein